MKNIFNSTFEFIVNHKSFFIGYVVATILYLTAQIIIGVVMISL